MASRSKKKNLSSNDALSTVIGGGSGHLTVSFPADSHYKKDIIQCNDYAALN